MSAPKTFTEPCPYCDVPTRCEGGNGTPWSRTWHPPKPGRESFRMGSREFCQGSGDPVLPPVRLKDEEATR